MRNEPITVHCTEPTHKILQDHIFNWKVCRISPKFLASPRVLEIHHVCSGRNRRSRRTPITVLPANHVVPAVGFHLDSGDASLVFTGDTTINDALWTEVNRSRTCAI